MTDKILNFVYKVFRLYKPQIDRWVVKAFIGSGFTLIVSGLTGISWYVALFLNIVKEESEKQLGTDYGIGTIEWITFFIGLGFVVIGLIIYYMNKRLDLKQQVTPHLLIAIIHKSIDEFMIPELKQINNGKYQDYQIQTIEIDQTKTYTNGNLEYPDYSVFEQEGIITKIKTLVDSNPNNEIAYFGLAHIPLLFYLGIQVADKFKITFFEYNRTTFQWDILDNGNSNLNVIRDSKIEKNDSSNAIVMIEISYPIRNELAYEVVPDYKISFNISSDNIGIDSISNFTDISKISLEFRKTIDTIIKNHPNIETVHVFYAGPPSLAVNLARKISRRTDPKFIVYNYVRAQKPNYKWGILLNSEKNTNNLLIKN